jgi:type IV pilus assembly protein PilN
MAKINLLPWRDAYRKQKKQEFIILLLIVLAVAIAVAFAWVASVDAAIENQNSRNKLLERNIAELQKQVDEIQELKRIRDELSERIRVIQALEGTRPLIVRYFHELVVAVPDGIYLNKVTRTGEEIRLEGITESNTRVSSFMRNLNQSDWFTEPTLTSVIAEPKAGEQASAFIMTVKTTMRSADVELEEKGDM